MSAAQNEILVPSHLIHPYLTFSCQKLMKNNSVLWQESNDPGMKVSHRPTRTGLFAMVNKLRNHIFKTNVTKTYPHINKFIYVYKSIRSPYPLKKTKTKQNKQQ